jgi:hypothetical protein
MFNFIDIMRAAQGGRAIENMSRQFGITPDQTRHAVAALLPAFAMGLQQAASRPDHLERLFEVIRTGRYDAFFDDPRSAFSKKALAGGETLVGAMFGSPELAKSIAEQSAAFSGVAAETATKMMPLLASTLMGGIAKSAQGDDFPTLFARMMSPPAPEPPPPANPWEQFFGAMTAGAVPGSASTSEAARSENPFEEMLAAMLRASAPAEPEPPPQTEAERFAEETFANYEKMMQLGREVQDRHLQTLKSLFDGFLIKRN